MTRNRRGIMLLAAPVIAVFAAGCGDDDFANNPRPAVPKELTGVIQEDKVTISPSKEGAGPILLTISNQTDDAHTVILEGEEIRKEAGPVNQLDVATLQVTLKPGAYEVRAGSRTARRRDIQPATLTIGQPRKASNDELLLP
jgi:hypothetical protein